MKKQNTTNKNKKIEEIKSCAKILLKISNRKSYIELFYKYINSKIDTFEYIEKMDTLINETKVTDDELNIANSILKELFLSEMYTLPKVIGLINAAINNRPIDIKVETYNQISNQYNYNSKKITISHNSNKKSNYNIRSYREILVPIRN